MSRFANLAARLQEPLPGESAAPPARHSGSYEGLKLRLQTGQTATPPKPAAKGAPAKSKAQMAAEEADAARRDAQARYDNVMSSDAVQGREKQAAELLLASCDRNAKLNNSSAIIAELRTRPTDAERNAKARPAPSAKATSDAARVWERAYGIAPASTDAQSSGPWDKAERIISARRGIAGTPNAKASAILGDQRAFTGKSASEQTSDDVWDRARERARKNPTVLQGF